MSGRLYKILVCHPDLHERSELVDRLQHIADTTEIGSVENLGMVAGPVPAIVIFRPEVTPAASGDGLQHWLAPLGQARLAGHERFVALMGTSEASRIPHLFRARFSAFILPDAPADELEAVIRTVRQGGIYLARELADALFSPDRNRQQYIAAIGLTAREQEVLRFIAVNMSNKDIARRLDLSVRTVETHRLNIRKKTNAGNWRELAVIAERLGLLGDFDLFSGLAARKAAPGFHED